MVKEINVIYDQTGQPTLRLLENGRLVDFRGQSIGFVDSGSVYNYRGKHCGWYEGGILRDHSGDCVGFGEKVTETAHPLLPLKSLKPLPALVELEPLRPLKELVPLRPLKSLGWSPRTPVTIFFEER